MEKSFNEVTNDDFLAMSEQEKKEWNAEWWRRVTDGPLTDDTRYNYDEVKNNGWG